MIRILLVLGLVVLPSAQAGAQAFWTGRDIAATAQPIITRRLPTVDDGRDDARRGVGRPYGYRPPRSLYLDPFGNVTVFAGAVPFWMRGYGASYDYEPATPSERGYDYGPPRRERADPCVSSGGPATASSAIASAANASGRRC